MTHPLPAGVPENESLLHFSPDPRFTHAVFRHIDDKVKTFTVPFLGWGIEVAPPRYEPHPFDEQPVPTYSTRLVPVLILDGRILTAGDIIEGGGNVTEFCDLLAVRDE